MKSKTTKIFLIGLFILFGVLAYKQFRPLTREDCYKLGSNYRTNLCLEDLESKKNKNSKIIAFPQMNNLILSDIEFKGNSNPDLYATLTNSSDFTAKNVYLRIKIFDKNSDGNCDKSPLDTVYIRATNLIFKGDSIRLKSSINSNLDTSGGFSGCVDVFAAQL